MSEVSIRTAAPRRIPAGACPCPLPLPCQCSYATLLRARARGLLSGDPLLRNGHVLTMSSLVTAALGMLFWILATRWYTADTVGRSYAALSAAALLSGIGQLNLGDVLVRFVPTAGRHTRRVVLRCYGLSTTTSAVAAVVFLVLIPSLAPALAFLRDPVVAGSFIAATVGYTLFVLQDGALTGLRRPHWVLAENSLFSVAKAVLLAAFAVWALNSGILLSWSAALLISLAVTNVFLFRRAVPAHQRADRDGVPPPRMVRYAAADYLGSLFRLAAYSLVPLLVLGRLGAEQNAYFSLAWVIAYTFYLAALNMGSSLIVEAARDPSRLAEHGRRVLRNAGMLIGAGVIVTVAAAPWLLRLFGVDYAEHGTVLLRLLALSALPNLLVGVAIDVARAQRRMIRVMALQCGLCVLVLGLTLWLIPVMGLTGVGAAWLLAESVLALPLLLTLRRWLGASVKAAPATSVKAAPAAPATAEPAAAVPGAPAGRPAPVERSPR